MTSRRLAALRALAERPGTEAEGEAAKDRLSKTERVHAASVAETMAKLEKLIQAKVSASSHGNRGSKA